MPGLDGRKLYEKLRGRQQTKQIPFIFLASRSDIEEKLRPMVEGVEEFITKPFFLKDFVRRTKKVIDRLQLEKLQKRAVRPGVIQGRLEEMSILDLMQSLEMGQKSCQLTIRHGDRNLRAFLRRRAVQRTRGWERSKAKRPCFRWCAGRMASSRSISTRRRTRSTISRTTTGLLMEALRLMDEGQREGEGVPQDVEATEG